MLVFGTRPEAVKMAPVIKLLARQADLEPVVTVTAQHRGMLDQVLAAFEIVPDYDLDILQPRQSLADITSRVIAGMEGALSDAQPDIVLVQGDTTSTFVGALSAFYHRLPVVHLEAGLRTWETYSPYPEEMNRRLTGQLAALHLAATRAARDNLVSEGVGPEKVVITGNTVVDALLWTLEKHPTLSHPDLADLGDEGPPVVLATAHRRESWGEPLKEIGRALRGIAAARPDVVIVLPLHFNPNVREAILPEVSGVTNIRVVDPLSYPDFAVMLRRAAVVLTDSGGVQEEAPSVGVPVLIMRDVTERNEVVEAGAAKLVGTRRDHIVHEALAILADEGQRRAMSTAGNPFGDGAAAPRTVDALRYVLFGAEKPKDYVPLVRGRRETLRLIADGVRSMNGEGATLSLYAS